MAKILEREGYIAGFEVEDDPDRPGDEAHDRA